MINNENTNLEIKINSSQKNILNKNNNNNNDKIKNEKFSEFEIENKKDFELKDPIIILNPGYEKLRISNEKISVGLVNN